MKTSQLKDDADSKLQRRDESLSAADVARYLHVLARTHQGEKTGNLALGDDLRRLSGMLRAHGNRPISELAITDKGSELPFVWQPGIHPIAVENGKPTSRKRRAPNGVSRSAAPPRRTMSTLPDDPKSMSREEVELILEDDRLTKQEIAELGHERFGISKSSLLRTRRERAINSILSALRNERTMHVIAEQARRAGRIRSA